MARAPRGQTCDQVTSTVTSFGRGTAALYAEQNLQLQQADLRGDMVKGGVRGVKPRQKRMNCVRASTVGPLASVYQCTAAAQLCGR